MTLALLIKKLELSREKFIIAETLKEHCNKLKLKYLPSVKYLVRHKHLVKILKGIFYIKSLEERKFKKIGIDHHKAIIKALELRDIKNWYFSLETALKFNNLTHEFFNVTFIVTDAIFKPKPINIMGHTVKFIKLKPKLCTFGIIKGEINYSDPEKTVLDMIYLCKYHEMNESEIRDKIADYLPRLSDGKIDRYLKHYPSTVKKLVKGLI